MIARQTVLVADEHADVVKPVTEHLTRAGLHVITAGNGVEALDSARRFLPALIILEVTMPLFPGAEVLRSLKGDPSTADIPVVMISELKEEVDRIVCFELGADDYVIKPLSVRELTLRVKSILARRSGQPVSAHAVAGAITLDRGGHEVRVSGKRVDVTVREYRLLTALFSHPGRVFSREELLNIVWGRDASVEYRTVDTHMRRLRERLGSAAQQIQTVRGFGYKLQQP